MHSSLFPTVGKIKIKIVVGTGSFPSYVVTIAEDEAEYRTGTWLSFQLSSLYETFHLQLLDTCHPTGKSEGEEEPPMSTAKEECKYYEDEFISRTFFYCYFLPPILISKCWSQKYENKASVV